MPDDDLMPGPLTQPESMFVRVQRCGIGFGSLDAPRSISKKR